jgi:transcriptional regulator GlxA family with amidase domain
MGSTQLECKRLVSSFSDPRVRRIVMFVDRAFGDPTLTVPRIAREVHLSTSRVRQLMHVHLGQSTKHYLLSKRLLRAQVLLQSSFLSIKEVMVAVGMNDPTDFGREFKKMFGTSPRDYRRTVHDDLSRSA